MGRGRRKGDDRSVVILIFLPRRKLKRGKEGWTELNKNGQWGSSVGRPLMRANGRSAHKKKIFYSDHGKGKDGGGSGKKPPDEHLGPDLFHVPLIPAYPR